MGARSGTSALGRGPPGRRPTSPNVMYEKEYPGTFELDSAKQFFRSFELAESGESFSLQPVTATEDLAGKIGFFTSYRQGGRFITYYGDNHPTYAGNVVKAMASAKDCHLKIVRLFRRELQSLDLGDSKAQQERNRSLRALFSTLDDALKATVTAVNRLTPTIVEGGVS